MTASGLPNLPGFPIRQRLQVEGINVVLLDIPPDEAFAQNIFGLNEQGDVLWQVEPRPAAEPDERYTSMRDEVGTIVAQTQTGAQRKIDAKNGKVLQEEKTGATDPKSP